MRRAVSFRDVRYKAAALAFTKGRDTPAGSSSPGGSFSWQVFRSDRPKFASNSRLNATAEELKATNQGSLAYFGTYSVDEADKTVTFRTEGSTFPNSEGEVLKRVITKLTADELIYTNPTTTLGAQVEAVWKRVK
jgi:hypothetical protein